MDNSNKLKTAQNRDIWSSDVTEDKTKIPEVKRLQIGNDNILDMIQQVSMMVPNPAYDTSRVCGEDEDSLYMEIGRKRAMDVAPSNSGK